MKVLIVDDEPIARKILDRFLQGEPDVTEIHSCATGEEARDFLATNAVDIVFMDIKMPGINGLEALAGITGASAPIIVFVTAHREYALDAIEASAADYLLKPFDEARFARAFAKAKKRLHQEALARKSSELIKLLVDTDGASNRGNAGRISIHDGTRVRLVSQSCVLWVEASDKHVVLHTDEGPLKTRKSLAEVESMLDPAEFLRVHRSCIVALNRVVSLELTPSGAAHVKVEDGSSIAVSRSRIRKLRESLR